MKEKCYLYLIKQNNFFKIGFTKNPKQRFTIYKEHNTAIKTDGIFEVPNKKYETFIHVHLLKKGFKKVNSYQEWFEGNITNKDIEDFIKISKERENSIN